MSVNEDAKPEDYMAEEKKEPSTLVVALILLSFVLVIVGVGLTIWVAFSHFEAQAYNNVTGKDVSTWDAMWIELRVQSEAK